MSSPVSIDTRNKKTEVTDGVFRYFSSMNSDVALWLCSDFEECPTDQVPLRLLDIYMYYEDHCKKTETFLQSRDYIAKLIQALFPSVEKKVVSRNGQKYAAYKGIRLKQNRDLDPGAATTTLNSLLIPTIHMRDGKTVEIASTVTDKISMQIRTEQDLHDIDLNLIDISDRITVTRPISSLIQVTKSLRLCRGLSSTNGSSGEAWTTILDSRPVFRERSPACQTILPWLSTSEACGPCRTFHKKQSAVTALPTINENEDTIVKTSSDDVILQSVIEKISEKGDGVDGLEKLLKCQLQNLGKEPRQRRWTPEMIQLCLTLYCRSPQAYADLTSSGLLALPSKRLLQFYKNSVDQTPGVNEAQLDWMVKEAVLKNISAFGKRGGLILDEMSVQDDIQIVRKGDGWTVVGMVDNDQPANDIDTIIDKGNKVKMATHVLQFVFQGFTGFRWPVAYYATNPATTHQLYLHVWDIIENVEERGFCVDYIMMDGGSANRSLTSLLLGDSPRESGYTTPNVYDFTRSITLIQDIKHCFKKIRNGIESSKEENRSAKKGRYLLLEDRPVVWEHFEGAFQFNTQSGLRIHRHLTKEHIMLTPTNKMRNNLATQVLDKDMLYLMKAYQSSLQQPETVSSTVKLLQHTSVLVDFFLDLNRPVCHHDPRLEGISQALDFFNAWEMSVVDPRNLLTKECRDDLNCALKGFLTMADRVLANGDLLNPGYLNSDIVENLFCQQRGIRHGCNTNPSVLQYGPAINAICLGQTTVSRKNNSSTAAQFYKATKPGTLK